MFGKSKFYLIVTILIGSASCTGQKEEPQLEIVFEEVYFSMKDGLTATGFNRVTGKMISHSADTIYLAAQPKSRYYASYFYALYRGDTIKLGHYYGEPLIVIDPFYFTNEFQTAFEFFRYDGFDSLGRDSVSLSEFVREAEIHFFAAKEDYPPYRKVPKITFRGLKNSKLYFQNYRDYKFINQY
jgi:hypothetical protein